MAPKKGNKMSLNDFLADEATGKSWADDVDDLPLAPAPRSERYPGARQGGDYLSTVPDRADRDRMAPPRFDDRPPRQDVPFPENPPYTAYLGGLSFEATEGDVAEFFTPHNAVSIRIVTDRDGKPKGFGYIEFEQADALRDALTRSGSQLVGRTIRVGVAEAPKSGERGFGSSAAEEASQWRRAGPLPPVEGASSRTGPPRERSGFGAPGGGRQSDGPSGFDNMEVGSGGRSGFGSRFQASPAPPARDGPLRSGPPVRNGVAEPVEPTRGEIASDWRTGKPTESSFTPAAPRRGPFGGVPLAEGAAGRSPAPRHRDATEVDERFSSQERMGFGSKFTPTPPESPAMANRGPPRAPFERKPSAAAGSAPPPPPGPSEVVENWRTARPTPPTGPSRGPSGDRSNATPVSAAPSAPTERKKLDLKPRSAAPIDASADSAASSNSSTSKSNPFGGAKPVDVMEKEREITERLKVQKEQRAAEEKAKQERLRAEKEAALKNAPTGPRADRERAAGVSGAPTGPRSAGSGRPSSKKGDVVKSPAAESTSATGSEVNVGASSPGSTPASPAAAAPQKTAPPAGAWGKGRKASGALAGNSNNSATTNGSSTPAAEKAGATVDSVSEGVDKIQVTG